MVLELPSAAWCRPCSSLSFQLVPGAGPAALTLRCVHLGETPRPLPGAGSACAAPPRGLCAPGPPPGLRGTRRKQQEGGGRLSGPGVSSAGSTAGSPHAPPAPALAEVLPGLRRSSPSPRSALGCGELSPGPLPSWGPREPGGFPALLRPLPASLFFVFVFLCLSTLLEVRTFLCIAS